MRHHLRSGDVRRPGDIGKTACQVAPITVDDCLRAGDLTTGDPLRQARLPAGGQSTPMTFVVDGQQDVVIVAGGPRSVGNDTRQPCVATALPKG